MTKKTESKEKESSKTKPPAKKLTLYEAVQKNSEKEFIIVGALSLAGLLDQYEYEKRRYLKEDLKPSITMDELNKIIKEFLGE